MRRRKTLSQLTEELERETRAKESLLDILNAILSTGDGTVVIPAAKVQASRRHSVQVEVTPADPDVAGSEMVYVITLEGYVPPKVEKAPSVLERIGLWVPRR